MSHPAVTIAAVRGATRVTANDAPSILAGTSELLTAIMARHALRSDQVVSALFTVTADLDADFPAHAARRMGWDAVPMLCAREIPVPGSMDRVVRVLLTIRLERHGEPLEPVYLGQAAALRPDLAPRVDGPGRRLAIVGLGQIGGSVGLALRGRGWERIGFDADPAVLAEAARAGAIDSVAASLADACARTDLVVVAVPVDAAAGVLEAVSQALPEGAAVLDTCSTRAPVTPALRDARRHGLRAVGGHPLAGSEGHGFAAARPDLFRDAAFALMPEEAALPVIVQDLVRDLGAHPVATDPAAHDHALARTSHLPYLLSCALRAAGADAAALGLAGPGFRDMTRLAASDPRMAGAYCRANATEIAMAWGALRADMDRCIANLTSEPAAG